MNGYDYSYTTYTTQQPTAVDAAAVLISLFFMLFAIAIGYVISALLLSRIFKKAGIEQWAAWVPFYNTWRLLEIGGQQGFWAVLAIIPIVNIVSAVFMYIAMYHIGKKLGKPDAFVLWAIFIPIVWLIWLAVDKSKWGDTYKPATTQA